MIYRALKSTSTHDFLVGLEFFGLIGRYFLCRLELVPRCFIGSRDHPLAVGCVHGAGWQLRDINLAILIDSLGFVDDFQERARNTSGSPEFRATIIVRISVRGTCLNPVAFLATAVADVARWRRLIRDCRLLREERSVVNTLTIIESV